MEFPILFLSPVSIPVGERGEAWGNVVGLLGRDGDRRLDFASFRIHSVGGRLNVNAFRTHGPGRLLELACLETPIVDRPLGFAGLRVNRLNGRLTLLREGRSRGY
jgi:hypothetical protein